MSGLPEPEQEALKHSLDLYHRIREEILHNNSISFFRYMQMALYEPGLGYYSAGASKIGKAGDFITAPELSSLFTKCLARQCLQIITETRQPVIIEIGPGTGVMMCDLLQTLEEKNALPEKYMVLETGADLRYRQQKLVRSRIPHLESRIEWLDSLPEDTFNGIIIGNEVIDAMPVHRLIFQNGKFNELCVVLDNGKLDWIVKSAEDPLQSRVQTILSDYIPGLPEGYRTEMNLQIESWIASLAKLLERGVMLFIDYGYPRHEYYHPQRTDGTLLCHYRHYVHSDPFFHPGLQDITASVDFTTVAEAADHAGLRVTGYTTQAHFLMNCGLEEVMNENDLISSQDRAELGRQARLLTMPGEMGERFKVIALNRNLDVPLTGFQHFDQRQRL